MYMIMFVLHDPSRLNEVLSTWNEAGVSGITILPSTGLKRLQEKFVFRDDIPLIPNLDDLLKQEEVLNRTLLTIVPSDEMVEKVVAATQVLIGDLNLPNTGILAVIPLAKVYGLDRKDYLNEDPHS
ncbi:MAG: P-II family nitrogen regulator [Anaerolineaceae bacterium]